MRIGNQRIGVLVGGITGQRDVALQTAAAITDALAQRGHDAVTLFADRDVDLLLRQKEVDAVFLALQGRYGEDGCIQGLLELLGVPYTGSGVLASALAMNRSKTKELLRLHNVPTAAAYVFDGEAGDDVIEAHGAFGFPVIVRPVGERSHLGSSLAHDELELEAAVEEALRVDDQVLIERYTEGRSISVAVLDGDALGAFEVMNARPSGGWGTLPRPEVAFPARLSAERYRALLRLASLACEAIGCDGPASVDLLVSERGNEVVLNVDTMPAMLPTALFPRVAASLGMPFPELIERILGGARLRAHGRSRNRRVVQRTVEGPERRTGFESTAH